jgi:hypothetical protein
MLITFWPTLFFIALFERYLDTKHNRYIRSFFIAEDDGVDDPAVQDPLADEAGDLQISRVPFKSLVESFPNTYHVSKWRGSKSEKKEYRVLNFSFFSPWKIRFLVRFGGYSSEWRSCFRQRVAERRILGLELW